MPDAAYKILQIQYIAGNIRANQTSIAHQAMRILPDILTQLLTRIAENTHPWPILAPVFRMP
ncbi:hypothetical protein FHD45_07395 [Escherichia coli]|nr:hypothetical protein [Escherichia coli]